MANGFSRGVAGVGKAINEAAIKPVVQEAVAIKNQAMEPFELGSSQSDPQAQNNNPQTQASPYTQAQPPKSAEDNNRITNINRFLEQSKANYERLQQQNQMKAQQTAQEEKKEDDQKVKQFDFNKKRKDDIGLNSAMRKVEIKRKVA